MATPTLIYSGSGNRRFAQIALSWGFFYGARLPATVYYPPYFADQDWEHPNRHGYMAALEKHRPHMASVLDYKWPEQLTEVLEWAEEAAQFVSVVVIVPKVQGSVRGIPETIGGRPVRLGYSVPTGYGGTELPLWEFGRRPVHLLGGSPGNQLRLSHYLNVHSVDGNMARLMATTYCAFWQPGKRPFANAWPTLRQVNNGMRSSNHDLPYIAFERSCNNIFEAWKL